MTQIDSNLPPGDNSHGTRWSRDHCTSVLFLSLFWSPPPTDRQTVWACPLQSQFRDLAGKREPFQLSAGSSAPGKAVIALPSCTGSLIQQVSTCKSRPLWGQVTLSQGSLKTIRRHRYFQYNSEQLQNYSFEAATKIIAWLSGHHNIGY